MSTQTNTNSESGVAAVMGSKIGRRRLLLSVLAVGVVAAGATYTAWYLLHGRWFESTEDAYANGNVVQITPQLGGTVVAIGAEDYGRVRAGQTLVELDPAETRVALDQAEAALARAVRQVRGLYSNVGSLDADVAAKRIALDRARADLARRQSLAATGAIPQEELAHAREAVDAAASAFSASDHQLGTSRALVDDTALADHPDVKAASAVLRKAYLDFSRSTIKAPVGGFLAQRSIQLGQRVQAGTPLMTIVPLDQLWVEANFKETQLEKMRIGQGVTLHSDLFGKDIEYHGHIAGLAMGTGSAFSLLPAQNATGNWIKIVQRVPVRIALDPAELNKHPLRIGLSMSVEVDLHDRSGSMLAQTPAVKPVATTAVYAAQLAEADAKIAAILRANSGHKTATARHRS
jgi:membrane fusion protein (multidrug efflux system)